MQSISRWNDEEEEEKELWIRFDRISSVQSEHSFNQRDEWSDADEMSDNRSQHLMKTF